MVSPFPFCSFITLNLFTVFSPMNCPRIRRTLTSTNVFCINDQNTLQETSSEPFRYFIIGIWHKHWFYFTNVSKNSASTVIWSTIEWRDFTENSIFPPSLVDYLQNGSYEFLEANPLTLSGFSMFVISTKNRGFIEKRQTKHSHQETWWNENEHQSEKPNYTKLTTKNFDVINTWMKVLCREIATNGLRKHSTFF